MDKSFDFDTGLERYAVSFGKEKKGQNELYLSIKYSYSLLSQKDTSTFNIEISVLYNLNPIKNIDEEDIYICVLNTEERLTSVVKSIFTDTQIPLELELNSYEFIKEEISKFVSTISLL